MTVRKNARHATKRWLLLAVAVGGLTLGMAAIVLAVHDQTFQLDGDTSTVDIAPLTGITRPVDWDSLYDSTGAIRGTLPGGYAPGALQKDFRVKANGEFDTSDGTTYTGGSKDTLEINTGWRCVGANNVTNKGDIINAYATQYIVPANGTLEAGNKILYFGMEKYVPQGTNNIGIWFLQNKDVACAEGGTGNGNLFTGVHVNGDILIVSAFSNGGAVSTILAYSWQNGSLVLETPTAGVDCRATPVTVPSDKICAVANQADVHINWPHASSADGSHGQAGSHDIPPATFFEGGINTDAFPAFSGKCFTKFVFDTRSAVSTTATLYDFTVGRLGDCGSTTETTPQLGNGDPIPAGGASIGTGSVSVRDHAVVKVTGIANFGGSVTFHLCGPLALDSTSNCESGGVQIGSAVNVTGPSPATANSTPATLTRVARYCWRANYSGDPDADVPASADPPVGDTTTTTECFVVNPVQPTLTTQASGPVALGNAISDTATLSGTANAPGTNGIGPDGSINATNGLAAGGQITWRALGPNNCTTVAMAATSRDVTGNGTYPKAGQAAVSFIPGSVGTYTFVALYTGQSPNTKNVAESACPDTTGTETVLVTDTSSIITNQDWLPNDSATITSAGGSALNGSVVFTLYNNGTCSPGTANADVLYTEPSQTVSGASPVTKITHNTAVKVLATATVSWKAVYTSNDTNVSGSNSSCETTTLTIDNHH